MKRATPPGSPDISSIPAWIPSAAEIYAENLGRELEYYTIELALATEAVDNIMMAPFSIVAMTEQKYKIATIRYDAVDRDMNLLIGGGKRPYWGPVLL